MKQLPHTRSLGIYGSKLTRFLMMLALMLPLLAFSPAQENTPKAHAALLEMAARQPNATVSVIVQKTASSHAEQTAARLGGKVTKDLHIINAFVAEMPGKAVAGLAKSDGIRWVSLDAPVVKTGGCSGSGCIDTGDLKNAYVKTIGADRLWNGGPYIQGQGITVAVVDSGVTTKDDIKDRVLTSVKYNINPVDDTKDQYGHGTHVAGIIGGNGKKSDGKYIGVAPKVNMVNVKVGDNLGMTTASDVVMGLTWVYDNKDRYNIRVVNLSLNSAVAEPYHTSPLNAAVEILWFNKIVVVVSAGNNGLGMNNGVLYPPANDPFVITVGATNDMGTAATDDDVLAPYSAYGTTADGFSKPDLVAPGTNIVSLLAKSDEILALGHQDHITGGGTYFRMSGTSMAAAVASGSVALLLQDEPNLNPDQVKYRLMSTARPMAGDGDGAGVLDIYAAVRGTSTETSNTGIP
ncbi:MAG TPA: S8 family serine peptidase, partial [Chloroflexia bacterium]|nr:S8 family serine peptidase [Chloroflexia bacterium]